MKLSQRVEKLFYQAWTRLGKPEMKVIRPVAEWNLPVGYTYDESTDTVVDASGQPVVDVTPYQTYDMVPMMPGGIEFTVRGQQDQDVLMTGAGLAPNSVLVARVLPAFSQILDKAFAIQIDGEWYDMNGLKVLPEGSHDKAWANVTLRRR